MTRIMIYVFYKQESLLSYITVMVCVICLHIFIPHAGQTLLSPSPVNLTYDVFDGKGDGTPLVFLHGLFGSKSNFHSIAKSLVQRTGRKVRFQFLRWSRGGAHVSQECLLVS